LPAEQPSRGRLDDTGLRGIAGVSVTSALQSATIEREFDVQRGTSLQLRGKHTTPRLETRSAVALGKPVDQLQPTSRTTVMCSIAGISLLIVVVI